MTMQTTLQRRAFSLIELVIVIVIIGIIAAIAVPRMSRGAAGATDAALRADLATLRAAIDLYHTEHEGIYWGSDHYPFARRGVPALFFFSGIHRDLHVATDNVDRADTDQATRIVKLAFLAGLHVANADRRPAWDEDARRRVMGAHE